MGNGGRGGADEPVGSGAQPAEERLTIGSDRKAQRLT
jgi:hypothetical protein